MTRNVISSLAAAAVATAVLHVSFPTQALAYQCKDRLIETKANQKGHARIAALQRQAIQAWSAQAKARYGLPWSVWKIAAARSTSCGNWQGHSTCIVKAKPCRYVVQ